MKVLLKIKAFTKRKNIVQNINLAELCSVSWNYFPNSFPHHVNLKLQCDFLQSKCYQKIFLHISIILSKLAEFLPGNLKPNCPLLFALPSHLLDSHERRMSASLLGTFDSRVASCCNGCTMHELFNSECPLRKARSETGPSFPRIPYPSERQVRSCHPSVSVQFDAERHKQVEAATDCSYHFASIDYQVPCNNYIKCNKFDMMTIISLSRQSL